MLKLLKQLFAREEPKQEAVEVQPKTNPMVKEPILTFVKVFKENPRRFRVRQISDFKYEWEGYDEKRFRVVDKKLQITFDLQCISGRAYKVFGVDFDLNLYELRYLWDELYPVAWKTIERYHVIRDVKVQQRLKAEREAQQVIRNRWLEVYSE